MEQGTRSNWVGQGANFALLDVIKGGFLLKNGHTAITKTNAKTTAGWKALLAPATIAAIEGVFLSGENGTEATGGENEVQDTNVGTKVRTGISANMLTVYAKMSFNDYTNYYSMEETTFKFFPLDLTKSLYNTNQSNTNATGFTVHFLCSHALPTGGADAVKSYPFFIYFDDITEFGKNVELLQTSFTFSEAAGNIVPVGLDMVVKTPMTALGVVVLKATKRNSTEPYTGFTAATDFIIIESELDVGMTIATADCTKSSLGEYTLTISDGEAEGTAYPTGYTKIQARTVATSMTYLTNVLEVQEHTT